MPPKPPTGKGLTRTWHGAPIWVWALGGSALGFGLYRVLKARKAASSTASSGTLNPANLGQDFGMPLGGGIPGGGMGGGGTGSGDGGTPGPPGGPPGVIGSPAGATYTPVEAGNPGFTNFAGSAGGPLISEPAGFTPTSGPAGFIPQSQNPNSVPSGLPPNPNATIFTTAGGGGWITPAQASALGIAGPGAITSSPGYGQPAGTISQDAIARYQQQHPAAA